MNSTIVGRDEYVKILAEDNLIVPAKIDTGADSSSIWASELEMSKDGELSFVLFSKDSEYYTGVRHKTTDFSARAIRSSNGTKQLRYAVMLDISICGRHIRGDFTLSDRSKNNFPILIGKSLLEGNFIVDVSRSATKRKKRRPSFGKYNRELSISPKKFFEKYHKNNQRGDLEV